MIKKGRKKGSKNKLFGEPCNFTYWKTVLKNRETLNAFLDRGSDKQRDKIKEVLIYLKRAEKKGKEFRTKFEQADIEFFKKYNGEEILKEKNA